MGPEDDDFETCPECDCTTYIDGCSCPNCDYDGSEDSDTDEDSDTVSPSD